MNVVAGVLIDSFQFLQILSKKDMTMSLARKVKRSLAAAEKEIQDILTIEKEKADALGGRVEGQQWVFDDPANLSRFVKERTELYSSELSLAADPIKFSDLEDAFERYGGSVTAELLNKLDWMFTD